MEKVADNFMPGRKGKNHGEKSLRRGEFFARFSTGKEKKKEERSRFNLFAGGGGGKKRGKKRKKKSASSAAKGLHARTVARHDYEKGGGGGGKGKRPNSNRIQGGYPSL